MRDVPAAPPSPPGPGLEVLIGIRWFNVAGIVTLLFAVAFFLKYAYENSWIGPRGRVAIGVMSGVASILVGEITRRRGHRVFSQGLAGGGIAALYLSFFFSFRLYELIEIGPAFALMVAAAAAGAALSVAQNSLTVAFLSVLGAYLTPVLLSTGQDAAEFLFAYLTIVALAVLGIAFFKRWRALEILAFLGTYGLYGGWHAEYYSRERLAVALVGLAVFFTHFLLIFYANNLARRTASRVTDHALAMANAVAAFGFLYRMIHPISPRALGFIALGLSASYLGLASLGRRRVPGDRGMSVAVTGVGIAFLTLVIPLQLGLHGITLGWAVQGLVVLYLGFRYEAFLTRLAGVGILCLSIVRLAAFHLPLHADPFRFVLNATFGAWVGVAAATAGVAWLYHRLGGSIGTDERRLRSAALVTCLLLITAALHLETGLYFSLWSLDRDHQAGAVMLVWSLLPLAGLAAGRRLSDRPLRIAATVLAGAAGVQFLRLLVRVASNPDALFGNAVFWLGVVGGASFFAVGEWHRRNPGETVGEAPVFALFAGAGATSLWILTTIEVHSHFRLSPGAPEVTAANSFRALLAVSVLWTIDAAILMAIGFGRQIKACRYAAFGLLGLTLAKVYLMDIWELRGVYRILSFVFLGALLVGASYHYSRLRSRIAVVLLGAALTVPCAGELRAAFEPSEWRSVRSIESPGAAAGEGDLVRFVLDEEALASSRADLSDLRILDRGGEEVPYVVHARRGGVREEVLQPRIVNRGQVEGGERAELLFESRTSRNRLRIETTGDDFRRRVLVEASDDGREWTEIVETWITRIPASASFRGTTFDEIVMPDNDQPRLRVTVFPMPEEDRFELVTVRAWERVETEPETAPLRVASSGAVHDPNTRTTAIEVDLGYRHARPLAVELEFEDRAFRRSYRAFVRNDRTIVSRQGRTETGVAIEREVEAPWQPVAEGAFYRVPSDRGGDGAGFTRIDLQGRPARYLKIVLDDRDNPPLRLAGVRARGLVHRVIFPFRPGGSYLLYYGNENAASPSYDLPALLPDLETITPVTVGLGPETANPLRAGEPEPPFTERRPWVLWVVLLVGVGGLAAVALRNLRSQS